MVSTSAEAMLRSVRQFHDRERFRLEGDASLLTLFIETRNELAFEELLRRHGPLVWGICARHLGNGPDAEDAFQAVFLILVRKAPTLSRPAQLAGWLCGTAQKVVRRSRRNRAVRHSREVQVEQFHEPGRDAESPKDWLPLFDDAVLRLPEKYREVLILCELQQLSRSDAARRLNLNENTVSSRLARAREMLRNRLARTGVALPAGLIATATVPASLTASTLKLALELMSCSGPLVKILPLALIPLIQGGMSLMTLSKWLIGLTLLVGLGFGTLDTVPVPSNRAEAQSTSPKDAPKERPVGFVTPAPDLPMPSGSSSSKPMSEPQKKGETTADLKLLQGIWSVKSFDQPRSRKDTNDLFQREGVKFTEVLFLDSEILFLAEDSGIKGNFLLGEKFNPKRFDLRVNSQPSEKTVESHFFGCYQFVGSKPEEVVIRFGRNRLARPDLEAEVVDEESVTFRLERRPLLSLPSDENGRAMAQLLGEWEITQSSHDGEKADKALNFLYFLPDKMLIGDNITGVFQTLAYTLDSGRNPRWINLSIQRSKEFSSRGIYQLEGGQLQMVLGDDKKPRPSEFVSEKGSNFTFLSGRRKNATSYSVDLPITDRGVALPTNQSATKLPEPVLQPTSGIDLPPPAPSVVDVFDTAVDLPIVFNRPHSGNEVKDLRLWTSTDGGKTFTLYESNIIRPNAKEPVNKIRYDAKGFEGEVHFALQVVSEDGRVSPTSQALRSQMSVRFVNPKSKAPVVPILKVTLPAPTKNAAPTPDLKQENEELKEKLLELQKRIEALEKSRK